MTSLVWKMLKTAVETVVVTCCHSCPKHTNCDNFTYLSKSRIKPTNVSLRTTNTVQVALLTSYLQPCGKKSGLFAQLCRIIIKVLLFQGALLHCNFCNGYLECSCVVSGKTKMSMNANEERFTSGRNELVS
jgi:hypothetical protein